MLRRLGMTILDAAPNAAPSFPETDLWREVEDGFWAGSCEGEFLGTIEVHGKRFFARNRVMGYVGEYRTLEAAQAAIAAPTR
jgi:hypothetical protein